MDSNTQISWAPVSANGGITYLATVSSATLLVSQLPATGTIGQQFVVSDASTPASLSNIVGGGAVTVIVFWNGSHWVVL